MTVRLDVSPDAAALSDQERWHAGRFAFPRDRRRYVVARTRLRELLGARLGVPAESVELAYGPHGKPALGGRFAGSDLRFNTSHCEDIASYAFAYGQEVGIDIERVRVMSDADDLASRFFSDAERADYRELEPSGRSLGFFNCWTRKEAFIKALGDGLNHPLHRFDVTLVPGEPARLLRVAGWSMMSFSPASGFVGAVVIEGRPS
ncbi:MAG TPA: 4'-phosphopantetheinyl transferase superfamily protein [Gemmatimonadales bacterium]